MKRRTLPIVLGALSFALAIAAGNPASADSIRDINRLARSVERDAAAIARETKHFIYSPYHRDLVNNTEQLRSMAAHTRSVAQSGFNTGHLRRDVMELGTLYRVLESNFQYIERIDSSNRDARRVRKLLDSIRDDITQMQRCLPSSVLRPAYPGGVHPGGFRPGSPSGHGFGHGMGGVGHSHSHGHDFRPTPGSISLATPNIGITFDLSGRRR